MKNFFKKLAFVLALAMIVTAIAPAGKASAAAGPSYKVSKKVLYIGGDKTGTYDDTYRFTFNNAKGYTATWKSSAPKVATIDAKSGKIQAVAVGTSVITAKLTNKAGKSVALEATVTVKQNTDKIGFGSLAGVKNALAVGDSVKINVYRQVGTTKDWSQASRTLSTDWIKWTSSDASVATVKAGKVTAVAAGKATITATAVQTEGNTAVTSATFEVEVAAGLTSVKQTSLTTIEAKFAGDLSAVVNRDNVKVFSMVGTTKVVMTVKDVKFDETDKTKATISTYVDFASSTEYVVEYKDTAASFKGVNASADAVASIAITTTTAVPNTQKALEFKVFDANGVDITKKEFTDRIDVSQPTFSSDGYLDAANKKVTIYEKGKSLTIKASFNTYKVGTDYKLITIDTTQVITGQPDAPITVAGIGTTTTYFYNNGTGTPDFTKPKAEISIDDKAGKYAVAVQTKNSKGDVIKSTTEGSKFKFYTSDASTLIVSETTGQLFPVKEGAAQIIVKYDGINVDAFTVKIGGKRIAYDVQATLSKATLTSGAAYDKVVLTVEVKDQYGDNFPILATCEYLSGPKTVIAPVANAQVAGSMHKTVFEFKGDAGYSKEGTYQYKVKAGDYTRYPYFTVGAAKTDSTTYKLSNQGKSVLTTLKYNDSNDSVAFDMELEKFGSNGYKTGDLAIAGASKESAFDTFGGATGTKYYVEITDPDNKTVNDDFYTISGNKITVKPVIGTGGALVKLKTGNYTVRAFSLTRATTGVLSATGCAIQSLTVANYVINDAQVPAMPKLIKSGLTGTFATSTLITTLQDESDNKVVEVKIGETLVNAKIDSIAVTGVGSTYYVTKLFIKVPTTYTGETGTYFVQEVDVSLPFTFSN